NVSLQGFWYKLFAGASGFVEPLSHLPALARAAAWGTNAVIVGLFCWQVRTRRAHPALTFALAAVVMLLIAPIAWNHYLLLLLPALAIWWVSLPESPRLRWAFAGILVAWTMGPSWLWQLSQPETGVRFSPLHTVTVLSITC